MAFKATLIYMVDPQIPIYFELQRLQIHDFQGNLNEETVKIREFATILIQNISDLEGRPKISKGLECHF